MNSFDQLVQPITINTNNTDNTTIIGTIEYLFDDFSPINISSSAFLFNTFVLLALTKKKNNAANDKTNKAILK